MKLSHYRSRILLILLTTLLLLLVGVTAAQPAPASYVPLRLAGGTFDPLQTPPESLNIPAVLANGRSTPYHIVQFTGPITAAETDGLAAAGADILLYIPDFAFLVRADAAAQATIANLPNFRWMGAYLPYFRLAPALVDAYVKTAAPDQLLELVVLLPPDVDDTAVTQAVAGWGGAILDQAATHWKITLRLSLSSGRLADLASLPDVQWVEPYYAPQLFNSRAVEVTNVETVWDTHGLYGAGQIVAVADSGFDQGSGTFGAMHPDFSDGSGGSRVLALYETAGDGNLADDATASGHGTHVAGTVLGNGLSSNSGSTASNPATNSFSSDTDAGVAPHASLVLQALWNNTTDQLLTPADLNTLFAVPYADGARIHTNSWGSAVYGLYTNSSRDVDEFTWDQPDMLILFAAGNDGEDANSDGVVDLDSTGAPGTAKNALTVGASENNEPGLTTTYSAFSAFAGAPPPLSTDRYADNVNGMAAFSSRGYTDDGRIKPDIVAPGTAVTSACAAVAGMGCAQGDYVRLSGTSMATPHVAGAAALAREFFVDQQTITPSGSLLKATLLNSAVDIYPGQYGLGATQEILTTRPSPQAGWGRLDLEAALFPASPTRTWYWDVGSTATLTYPWTGLQTNDVVSYTFEVSQMGNVSATLVWNDYPGSPLTSGSLVNDLDLHIEGPGGTSYYPNNASQTSPYLLSYDDGGIESILAWPNTTGMLAVRFTPGFYPANLVQTRMVLNRAAAGSTTFGFSVFDDNGTGGLPGTLLCSGNVPASLAAGTQIVTLDISGCGITLNSGDVYVAFRQVIASDPRLGADTTASTGRSYSSSTGATWSQDGTNNYMVTAGFTNPATSFDRVNNVVGIDIPNAATGTYTVTLSGYNVPFGPQPYAFVLSAPGRLLGTETVTRAINGTGTYIFGNTGVAMTFSAEDVDTVSVTVRRDQFPTVNAGDPVINRRYDITSSGGSGTFTADVAFSYEDAELNGQVEGNLQPFRWNGSIWQPLTVASRDTTANVVQTNGVTAFSSWVLGTPTPTAVSLTTPRIAAPAPPAILLGALLLLLGLAALLAFRARRA